MARPHKDLTGMVFGRLTVIDMAGTARMAGEANHPLWRCRCICGAIVVVPKRRLPDTKNGRTPGRRINACPACRLARICDNCGATFVADPPTRRACSNACQRAVINAKRKDTPSYASVTPQITVYREQYYKRPEVVERQRQRAAQKRAAITEDDRQRNRDAVHRYWSKIMADPDKHRDYIDRRLERDRRAALAGALGIAEKLKDKI